MHGRSKTYHESRAQRVILAIALSVIGVLLPANTGLAIADTLDRIRQSNKLTLGYRVDARPFSYQDKSGKADGYSVRLCQVVGEELKAELGLPALSVEWVPVTVEDRFVAVKEGRIDLLCGAGTETLSRRVDVDFSIPIFPSGIAALLRADAPPQLRDILAGKPQSQPIWRGSPARILETQTFSAVTGTTGETWLRSRLEELQIPANVVPVESYQAGIVRVIDGSSDVFFGDRAILLESAAASPSAGDLIVLERQFTYEHLALALGRNEDDLRLIVDRALSRSFTSADFRDVYVHWFGIPDDSTLAFFRLSALPE